MFATAPRHRLAARRRRLPLPVPARPLRPSRLPHRVVVLHRQRPHGRRSPPRLRAGLLPPGTESRRRQPLRLARRRPLPGAPRLTDIDGRRFRYFKRLNRSGPGVAGIDAAAGRIWNGNWEARWNGESQTLTAVAAGLDLSLRLPPRTRSSSTARTASASRARRRDRHRTTSPSRGSTSRERSMARPSPGSAWMDHEWFTNQLAPEPARLGLVQHPARRPDGVDALPTAPHGRLDRPELLRAPSSPATAAPPI